jgi:hypothetical protein
MSYHFGYYLFGFSLGMVAGRGFEKDSMKGRINRLINESRQKSYQIQNYKKFIESHGLDFEYSQYIEKKNMKFSSSIDSNDNTNLNDNFNNDNLKIDDYNKKE